MKENKKTLASSALAAKTLLGQSGARQNTSLFPVNIQNEADTVFHSLVSLSPIGIYMTDKEGKCTFVNNAWCRMSGLTAEEAYGDGWITGIHEEDRLYIFDTWKKFVSTGKGWNWEYRFRNKQGNITWIYGVAEPIKDNKGITTGFIGSNIDITQRKILDAELSETRKNLNALIDAVDDSLFLIEPDGTLILANRKLGEKININSSLMLNTNMFDIVPKEVALRRQSYVKKVVDSGLPFTEIDKRSDSFIENRLFPVLDANGKVGKIAILGRDITLKMEEENLRKFAIELLHIINEKRTREDLIETVCNFMKTTLRMDAVGIRLNENEDFPYYEFSGFTEEFILKENYLCTYKKNGNILRDVQGNPSMDCMCGNVIRGRINPEKSYFTSHGSFWTNSTTELLLSDSESFTRNSCNGAGYESVALFPLRFSDKIYGLLQLNDRKKNRFTPLFITFLETIADNLALGLDKLSIDEELQKSEEKYRMLSEAAGLGIGLYSPEGIIMFYNSQALKNLGGNAVDYIGRTLIEAFGESAGGEYMKRLNLAMESEKGIEFEDFVEFSGKEYWFLSNHTRITDGTGKIIGVQVLAHDITERKLSEKALKESEARYHTLFEHSVVPIWETDFSEVKHYLDGLRKKRVKNFGNFFNKHPEQVAHCASLVRITELNHTSLDFFGLKNKHQLKKSISTFFVRDSMRVFKQVLNYLANGFNEFESDIPIQLPNGVIKELHMSLQVDPEHIQSLSKILITWIDVTDRKKYEDGLKHLSSELRDLTLHLEEAREKERSQISINLHDDLGQKLTALKMDISWLKHRMGVQSSIVNEKFEEMLKILDASVETIQKISSDLRPGVLYDLGLTAAIEWQLDDFSKRTGIISLVKIVPAGFVLNDEKLSIAIFRVIQESLTNIVRHAEATKVKIQLIRKRDSLSLSVRDNGIGISPEKMKSSKSFGLLGMRERVKAFSGELSITGERGKGTLILAKFPLKKTKKESKVIQSR